MGTVIHILVTLGTGVENHCEPSVSEGNIELRKNSQVWRIL